jgi:hypothetical protein
VDFPVKYFFVSFTREFSLSDVKFTLIHFDLNFGGIENKNNDF